MNEKKNEKKTPEQRFGLWAPDGPAEGPAAFADVPEEWRETVEIIGRAVAMAAICRRDEDFDYNEAQWAKYEAVEAYAKELARRNGATIERTTARRTSAEVGTVGIRFTAEAIIGENVREMDAFRQAIALCDGCEIFGTGLEDGSFLLYLYVFHMNVPKQPKNARP